MPEVCHCLAEEVGNSPMTAAEKADLAAAYDGKRLDRFARRNRVTGPLDERGRKGRNLTVQAALATD